MNNCSFIGRLGHDVSLRYTTDERAVGRFSLALDRGKDRDGNDKGTDWIECTAFGATAETIERFFHKGSRIGLICHVNVSHGDIDENGKRPKYTDFIVDRFDFVDDKKTNQDVSKPAAWNEMDDDMPF